MFSGEIVNSSEGRPATHVAERGQGQPADNRLAAERRTSGCASLIDAIEGGAFGEIDGILHIGIGGSALGPELVIDALGRDAGGFGVRVLSNIDGEAFDEATWGAGPGIDPGRRRQQDLHHHPRRCPTSTRRCEWLREAGVADPYGQVIAVTAAPEKAIEYGIDETRVLPFGEGVGGRYSLWSAVGFSIALALGWGAFEELLEGAAEMDRHVRLAEPAGQYRRCSPPSPTCSTPRTRQPEPRRCSPMTSGCGCCPIISSSWRWNRTASRSAPTASRSAARRAPVTWGGVGTDAQHAVFQLLHQGTTAIPVEFVAVVET